MWPCHRELAIDPVPEAHCSRGAAAARCDSTHSLGMHESAADGTVRPDPTKEHLAMMPRHRSGRSSPWTSPLRGVLLITHDVRETFWDQGH
ncbi:hypothetical protein NDU88_008726 [Pleurodeles waltl]|uniref:Uncharacterized protein n=1 Tax=Pleurodeles waltl TaxID=8319 RepID=A0AAV7RU31_PLEWA|nr:hypothetical protein NDU88_008726 [Pleurodeles waltl]